MSSRRKFTQATTSSSTTTVVGIYCYLMTIMIILQLLFHYYYSSAAAMLSRMAHCDDEDSSWKSSRLIIYSPVDTTTPPPLLLSTSYASSTKLSFNSDYFAATARVSSLIFSSLPSLSVSLLLLLLLLPRAAAASGNLFVSGFTPPPPIIHHHYCKHSCQLSSPPHSCPKQGQVVVGSAVSLFETNSFGSSEGDDFDIQQRQQQQFGQQQLQQPWLQQLQSSPENNNNDDNNNDDDDEQEKLKYLTLAKEAHAKFFSNQMSQEEYLNLALGAWNDANAVATTATTTTATTGSSADADADAATIASAVNGAVMKQQQSRPIVVFKGASSSSPTNNLQQKQQIQQPMTTLLGKTSNFPAQKQSQKFAGATATFNNGTFNVGNGSGGNVGGDASSSSMLQNGQPPFVVSSTSSSSLNKSSIPMNKSSSSSFDSSFLIKSNGWKKASMLSKGAQPSSTTSKGDTSIVPPPPLKGSLNNPVSKTSSSPPPPPPPSTKDSNDNNNNNKSNNKNPFELFGGLGSILFGKSKRPTPSTSLIGGLGMLYEEEDDIPYGLRVGTNVSTKVGSSDVVGVGSGDGGGGDTVGKVSQQMTMMMKKQETLKGATPVSSFGSTANINSSNSSSSSSAIIGTTKDVAMKGGQFQPSLMTTKKSVFNTTPNAATFKKGMMESKMGREGVLQPTNTKKMSVPIKTISTTSVTKTPFQPPPPSISNEGNSAQGPSPSSSSVLKSIDKNKEEIARTKSWIENEKRLDDVRKKVAEIQGTTPTTKSVVGGKSPFQFVAKAMEGEMSATKGGSRKKESDESNVRSLLPTVAEGTKKVEEVAAASANEEDWIMEQNRIAQQRTAERLAKEASVAAAAMAEGEGASAVEQEDDSTNEPAEDWIQEQNRIAQQRTAERLAKEAAMAAAAMAEGEEASAVKQDEDATNESAEDWIQEQNRIAQQRTAERLAKEAAMAAAAMAEGEASAVEQEDDATNEPAEDWIQEQNRIAQQRTAERLAKEAAMAAAAMAEGEEASAVKQNEDATNESAEDWIQEQNRIAQQRTAERLAKEAAMAAAALTEGEGASAVEQEDDSTNEPAEDWIQEQNRIAQQRTAERLAKEAAMAAAAMAEGEEASAVKQNEDATNESAEDWIQEQNRIAQQQQQAQQKAAAMVQEEARLAKERLDNPSERLDRSDEETSERRDVQSRVSIKEATTRLEGETKTQNARLNEAMKQSNIYNKKKVMMETEKPRSEQIPSGEYWLAEQNRAAEERQKTRLAKEAAGNPLKGSDRAFGLKQPEVPPQKMATPKKVEFANTGKGMPLKGESLEGNKSPFSTQPFMKQKTSKMDRPNVEPAASSMPLTQGPPNISTALRGSANEMRMIEKGFVPFKGTVSQEVNVPQNVQQVAVATPMPMTPIIKIEPSEATQMIAPTMPSKEGKSRLDLAEAEAWGGSLDDVDFSSLPVLRVGNRIRSSVYGTTHQVLLILPKEDGGYEILPCVAKRPWTMAELYANVPSKISVFEEQQSESAFDEMIPPESWEVDYNAKSVRRYWEVEIHCNKKFQQKKELYKRLQMQSLNDKKQKEEDGGGSDGADDGVSFAIRVAGVAVPKFYDVYPDDGSGGTNEDDIIPEYGSFGQDVWNKTIEFGHDWLVYESKLGDNEVTLLDAMMMQHEINKQFLEDGFQVHHLYGIQQAMKLPDTYRFGDVLDVIFRSLLENIAFLASCNVVHRKLNPSNIICDEDNGRLRIINFGDAVDLDPKETVRVGLDNDTLESNAPGAIANSLAADVFAVALVVCELLFDFDEVTFTAQIKEVGYDLDAWLRRTLAAEERPLGLDEALWYLSERRGLWALLKSMIKPNPLRRKITSASLQQFNEIIALKDGKIEETDQVLAGGDESFLNSVLFPSGSVEGSPGSVEIPPSARKTPDVSNDDIPQTQYTSTLPRATPSSSVLSELAEQINDDAVEQNQGTRGEGPNSNPKMQNPELTSSASNSDTYNDITRATFTPARASKLTAMLAPKSRDPVAQKQQSVPEQQSGNYYDITRASFERVSPQPMALTASQLYSILRESGARMPPQFQYDMTQSGYIPETNLEQSGYRGRNIVLPQKAVSANLPRGYVPAAQPTESISQEAYEEVEQWLLSYLPRLQKADLSNYCWSLIDEGFDSAEMLEELEFDDLHFMKKAHRRALVKILSKEDESLPEKAAVESNDQSLPKKVYKVEEALGEAARKGIEALVAASKTGTQTPDERKQILERFKAYEAKIAAEKAETERKIEEVQSRMQSEIRARAEEERELKELQDRIEMELQIKAKEERRLRELEKERMQSEIRARAEEERKLKELQDRIEAELQIKAKEERRLRELEKEMEQQQQLIIESEMSVERKRAQQVVMSDESPMDTTKWIEEQNRIANERNLARLTREKASRQNEMKSSTTANSEKNSRLASLIAKASEVSFEGMTTAAEAEMVRKARSKNESTEQTRQKQEKEKKVTKHDDATPPPDTVDDWYAEQNRLVQERLKARLAKEGRKE